MKNVPSSYAHQEVANTPLSTLMTIIFLLGILCLAGVFRTTMFQHAYAQNPDRIVSPDTPRYEQPALRLLENGTIRDSLPANESQDIHVVPAYSAFIYSVYRLFGPRHDALVYAQIGLSLINIVLLYLITALIWNRASGLAAATLFAVAPLQSLYSVILLSETLFVFSVLVLCYFSVRFLKNYATNPRFWSAALLGLAFGFSAMVRPISYYIVFLFLPALLIFHFLLRKHGIIRYLKCSVIILCFFAIVVGPWLARNKAISGEYLLTDNPGQIMLYWKAGGMLAYRDGIDPKLMRAQIRQSMPTDFDSLAEKNKIEKEAGITIIKSDIGAYLQFSLAGLKNILIGPGLSMFGNFFDDKNSGRVSQNEEISTLIGTIERKTGFAFWYLLTIAYSIVFLLSVYALFSIGLMRYWKQSNDRIILVFGVSLILYFILASTGHSGADSRLRMPATPIFLIFAGIGLSNIRTAQTNRLESSGIRPRQLS